MGSNGCGRYGQMRTFVKLMETDGNWQIQEHFLQFLEVQRVPIQYGCMANSMANSMAVHVAGHQLLGTEGLGSRG